MRKFMRKRTSEQVYADFKQAAGLLQDKNLVWSNDFDEIRVNLARVISNCAIRGIDNDPYLVALVNTLIADENDITIGR